MPFSALGIALAATHVGLRFILKQPFEFNYFVTVILMQAGLFFWVYQRLRSNTMSLLGIVLMSWVMHATYFGTTSMLSNDMYRYHWDAWVLEQGYNPLRYTPQELLVIHPEWSAFAPPDHRTLSSIYPPLSLLYFFMARKMSLSPMIYGVLATACNLVSIVIISKILKELQKPKELVIVFAWHPVVVFESAYGGHVDALGVMFILFAFYLVSRGRNFFASGFSMLAAFVKLWPIVLALTMLKGQKKAWFWIAGVFLGFLGLMATTYSLTKDSGLLAYASRWEFNGPLYSMLRTIFSPHLSRILCGLSFIGTSLYFFYKTSEYDVLEVFYYMILFFLIFSPTLYPWYLLWIIPCLCWHRSEFILGITLLMPLSYEVVSRYLITGEWKESPAMLFFIYVVPLFLLSIVKINSLIRTKTGKVAEIATTPIKGLDTQKP